MTLHRTAFGKQYR